MSTRATQHNTPIDPDDVYVGADLTKKVVSKYYLRGAREEKATIEQLTSDTYLACMRLAILSDENIKRLCAEKPVATPVSSCRGINCDWGENSSMVYAMRWVSMSEESRQKLLRLTRINIPGFSIRISASSQCNSVVFYLKEPLTKLASEFNYSLPFALDTIQVVQDMSEPTSNVSMFIRRAFGD